MLNFLSLFFLYTADRKVCVFDIHKMKSDNKEDEKNIFSSIIKDNIIFELKLAGFKIIDDSDWRNAQKKEGIDSEKLIEGVSAIKLGNIVNADVAISGFYSINESRILLGIKCYDINSRRLAVSVLNSGRAGLSATSLIDSTVKQIIPKISTELEKYSVKGDTIEKEIIVFKDITSKEMMELGEKTSVTLKSEDEDAYIFLADKYIGRISNGSLIIESKAWSQMYIEIVKPDFHEAREIFELKEDDLQINLKPLAKKTQMGFELQYTLYQTLGAGLGFRYYLSPDWFFIHANNYFYAQVSMLKGSNMLFHNDLNIYIGQYVLFAPDSIFRFGFSTGLGTVASIFLNTDIPISTSFYMDIIGSWIEMNFSNFIIYYKFTGRYYHDIFNNSLVENGWNKSSPVCLSIGAILKW